MVLKLNPASSPAWRNLTDLQFGFSSDALVLTSITEPERRLIKMLVSGFADSQLAYFAKEAGLDKPDAQKLIDRLGPVISHQPGATKPSRRSSTGRLAEIEFGRYSQNSFAEMVRAEASHRVQGAAILAQRGGRAIYLDSFGKTGLALARGLAAGGIGRIVTHDNRPVLPADIGADGFEQSQQGSSRISTVSSILSRNHLPARVSNANRMSNGSLEQLDFAVLVSQTVTAPTRYAIWARKQIPHINLTFGERFVDVTPVLVPGKNPCLRCLDLNRMAKDLSWSALASQALSSHLRFDDSASRFFAAGLAIKSTLMHLDNPAALGAALDSETSSTGISLASKRGFRLDLAEHRVYEFDWPEAANCGCLGATEQ